MSVQIVMPIIQVDVEMFHWVRENFDLLLAPDEKSKFMGFILSAL